MGFVLIIPTATIFLDSLTKKAQFCVISDRKRDGNFLTHPISSLPASYSYIFGVVCHFSLTLLVKRKVDYQSFMYCFSEHDFHCIPDCASHKHWETRGSVLESKGCLSFVCFVTEEVLQKFLPRVHLNSIHIFISIKATLLVLGQKTFIIKIYNFRKYSKVL